MDKAVICQLQLDEAKVKQFKDAIENSYWFEFFMGKPLLCSTSFPHNAITMHKYLCSVLGAY